MCSAFTTDFSSRSKNSFSSFVGLRAVAKTDDFLWFGVGESESDAVWGIFSRIVSAEERGNVLFWNSTRCTRKGSSGGDVQFDWDWDVSELFRIVRKKVIEFLHNQSFDHCWIIRRLTCRMRVLNFILRGYSKRAHVSVTISIRRQCAAPRCVREPSSW